MIELTKSIQSKEFHPIMLTTTGYCESVFEIFLTSHLEAINNNIGIFKP